MKTPPAAPMANPGRQRTMWSMLIEPLIAAQESWPEAVVAIAGITLVGSVIVVVVWQALATWRTRIAIAREEAYRRLAEQLARELQQLNTHLRDSERAKDEGNR
jgi:cytochrome c-type biogenesis protein CcmH/NrfG